MFTLGMSVGIFRSDFRSEMLDFLSSDLKFKISRLLLEIFEVFSSAALSMFKSSYFASLEDFLSCYLFDKICDLFSSLSDVIFKNSSFDASSLFGMP